MSAGTFGYLFAGSNWTWHDPNGFPHRLVEHLQYTGLALAIAFLIAFPIGLYIGHTDRGSTLAINVGNAGQALPTLGVLTMVVALWTPGLGASTFALVLLGIPPILTTTYAGMRSVEPTVVDAASGVGMRGWQVASKVELPMALPIIVGGLRNATLQIVSAATIAAYVGLGGLGRYLFDGLALRDYPRVVAGCVLVAVLAISLDLVMAALGRLVVSRGVDGRAARRGPRLARRRGTTPASAILSGQPVPGATIEQREGHDD